MCVSFKQHTGLAPTMPVLRAELHDFLEELGLLFCSHVEEKAQHQLRPQTLEGGVQTRRPPTAHMEYMKRINIQHTS